MLSLPAGYTAFNTDVTAGPGGYSYMAIELGAPTAIVEFIHVRLCEVDLY